jgi:carboxypeptidase T
MKMTKLAYAVLVLLFLPFFSSAQNALCRVKVYPPAEKQQRAEMMGLLEIDHFLPNADGSITAEISQLDLQRLKASTYRYEVLVPDVSKWLDSVNKQYLRKRTAGGNNRVAFEGTQTYLEEIMPTPAAFEVKSTFGGYYNFAEIEAAINTLVATYPTIASRQSIGTTSGGRNLWVVKISDNVASDESEPEAFFMGLQHPREAVTGSSMIFFMQYLCERYAANDPKIREVVDNREIFIMPCFNPDGWEFNRTSMSGAAGGSWRKNRDANTGANSGTIGTDLNRNWGVDWSNCSAPILGAASSCGSSSGSSDTYFGDSAFSERETQALRVFTKTRRFVVAFDQHAFGPYYSLPWGRRSLHNTASTDMSTKDSNFFLAVPALMGRYNGMRAADSYGALGYEVAGGFKDWMFVGEIGAGTKDSIRAITGEGGAGGGGPYGGMANFWAPMSEIENLSRGMAYQNLQFALSAGTYVDFQEASDIVLTSTTGSLPFNMRRIGLGNTPVTVSVIPLENMQSVGSPVTVNSMFYFQTVSGSINYTLPAGLTNGQRVRFAWKVEAGGLTYYDTVTKFLNPTSMFFDNMEGTFATNWTNTATGTPASGFGYNYSTAATNWQFTTTGSGYGGGRALSESAAGTIYPSASQEIAQCNTIFNLSDATAAYLTFWVRHRAENFRDKVQVQFSNNGGSTWFPVEGNITVQEAGSLDGSTINGQPALTGVRDMWSRAIFDLNAYRGFTNVRFRFVFTSDNDPTSFELEREDGFFIDDVRLIKSTAVLVPVPAHFISFNGQLTANHQVKLNWKASVETDHRYFEVEHSTDGQQFNVLHRLTGSTTVSNYQFLHTTPVSGNNYYRIKEVNLADRTVYTRTINVVVPENYKVSIFPNPVQDEVQVGLTVSQAQQLQFEFTDAAGRLMKLEKRTVLPGGAPIVFNMSGWPQQVYVLKITDSKGVRVANQRVSKL